MKSLAIPANCIGPQTCSSLVQATFSLYQIARACVLYGVDEIVVFQVPETAAGDLEKAQKKITFDEEVAVSKTVQWETKAAADLLQFFLIPTHLRKLIFNDMKPFVHAKKLPKVLGAQKDQKFVQGISIRKHITKKKTKKTKKEKADARVTPFVNFGFDTAFELEEQVPLHTRIAIDPKTKKIYKDVKCGYSVRTVDEFSKIFTESTIPDGYTHTFVVPCQEFFRSKQEIGINKVTEFPKRDARILLVVSDWQSLAQSIGADPQLEVEPAQLFDGLVDGFRGARLEDAATLSIGSVFKLDEQPPQ